MSIDDRNLIIDLKNISIDLKKVDMHNHYILEGKIEEVENLLAELDSKDNEIEELKQNRKFMEENIEDIKLVLLLYKQNKTLIKGTSEAFIKGYAQASEDITETLKQHFENLAKEEK